MPQHLYSSILSFLSYIHQSYYSFRRTRLVGGLVWLNTFVVGFETWLGNTFGHTPINLSHNAISFLNPFEHHWLNTCCRCCCICSYVQPCFTHSSNTHILFINWFILQVKSGNSSLRRHTQQEPGNSRGRVEPHYVRGPMPVLLRSPAGLVCERHAWRTVRRRLDLVLVKPWSNPPSICT